MLSVKKEKGRVLWEALNDSGKPLWGAEDVKKSTMRVRVFQAKETVCAQALRRENMYV